MEIDLSLWLSINTFRITHSIYEWKRIVNLKKITMLLSSVMFEREAERKTKESAPGWSKGRFEKKSQ
jgi:hypothetical protein